MVFSYVAVDLQFSDVVAFFALLLLKHMAFSCGDVGFAFCAFLWA